MALNDMVLSHVYKTRPILKNDQMGKGNLALAVNMGLIYRSDLESLL